SPADRDAVLAQLGRPPRGSWSVARRCACGLPQVIETSPRLDDGTPFPTMWWLTCRALSKSVGRLEAGGWMAAFNERLATDGALAASLAASTAAYVARRDSGQPLPGTERGHPGGGGARGTQPGRVKCLHAHTAHQLVSGDNPAGAAVLEELAWVDPPHPCL
ncbi:MAG TPA: DUF501 domain-containing protein, partial [Actinomycetota bacterium]|nr:DUF501 domain-containing protein [Actinomycetota bacterium]